MDKILLISRPTRLDSLVAKFNTRQQARFYIEHLGADFSDYENEHERYYQAITSIEHAASRLGKVLRIDWRYLPNYVFGGNDLVLAVGQDGLVANALKYIDRQKIIGFNPDPARWDGVLSRFSADEAPDAIADTLAGKTNVQQITRARIQLSDGQSLCAVNDFFIGIRGHVSARYELRHDNVAENQSSSGVIVSTPLGRSGWMKSVVAGSSGIVATLQGIGEQIAAPDTGWDDDELLFAVREPFPSVCTGANMVYGSIAPGTRFEIESRMGENGIIFSDGIQDDFLEFNYSIVASIGIDDVKGRIVVK